LADVAETTGAVPSGPRWRWTRVSPQAGETPAGLLPAGVRRVMTSRHDAPNATYRFQPEGEGLLPADARLAVAEGSIFIVSHSRPRRESRELPKNKGCPCIGRAAPGKTWADPVPSPS
jgi:hypothetical protein